MKKFSKHIIFFILHSLYFQFVFAQEPSTIDSENDMLENLIENENNVENGYESYAENLQYFLENKINLNDADYLLLRNSGLFTEFQIQDLQKHISTFGPFVSLYELQTIPSFELDDIYRIIPYITIGKKEGDNTPLLKQLYAGKYQYFIRTSAALENEPGYNEDTSVSNPYFGNKYRIYTRLKYNFNNQLYYGITAEKDPGETIFGNSQPQGFDYYSFHFLKKGTGFFKVIAVGDYEINIGQGLTMWSGFGLGKSIYPISIKKSSHVLDSYSSVNENRFLRGVSATMGNDYFTFTPFISYKSIDANITSLDSVSEEIFEVSSFQTTGLHRTESELADKDAIKEFVTGMDINFKKNQFQIGASTVYFNYNSELQKDISPYEIFDFEGNELFNSSLHYSYLFKNILFFGETANSFYTINEENQIGFATLHGFIIPVDQTIDLSILYRNYNKEYQSLFALAFSENTLPQNEIGTYIGAEIKPSRAWKIAAYIDVYKNPWLEFDADAPAYGTDFLSEINFKPSKTFEMYLRYKNEISDNNISVNYESEDAMHDALTDKQKGYVRWNIMYKLNRACTLKSRIEYSFYEEYKDSPESGYMIYQDFVYKPLSVPFSFATRFALFNTDTYNTRIYTYENDVLYAYSIIALNGNGMRSYFTLEYNPFRFMDLWFRIARTWYPDEIPSDTFNQETGTTKSDMKLQMRLKW